MKVRVFELINEKGQSFSLMDINEGCIFKEPENLGYAYTSEFQRLDYMYIEILRTLNQTQISGKLEFKNYDNYKNFIDFIEAARFLKWKCSLPYSNGTKTYYKDVAFQEVGKNDLITEEDKLITPVIFNCLSLWYEENTTVYTIEPVSNEIRWDFRWDSRFTDYNTRNLQFINKGHVEAPVLIEFSGKVINPKIQLYVEGKLYQELKFNITINEYEKLLYCTKKNEFYINKQNTDGTLVDLYNLEVLQDFDKINEVIRFPQNKSCELKLTADNDVLNAKTTIWSYYKAV